MSQYLNFEVTPSELTHSHTHKLVDAIITKLWCYQSITSTKTNSSAQLIHYFCQNQPFQASNPLLLPKPKLQRYQFNTSAQTNTSTPPIRHFCQNQHLDATNPPLLTKPTLRRYQSATSAQTNTSTLPIRHFCESNTSTLPINRFCRNQQLNATNPPLLLLGRY